MGWSTKDGKAQMQIYPCLVEMNSNYPKTPYACLNAKKIHNYISKQNYSSECFPVSTPSALVPPLLFLFTKSTTHPES